MEHGQFRLVGQAKFGRKMLCPRLAAVKWGPGAGKGVEVETAPVGLVMPKRWQMEKIRAEEPLDPDFFFKNQPEMVSGYSGSRYSHLSDLGS
jgi:hypothetical protein